ncbi:MAG: restriction endonuclease subunit S [Oscillospiraceae bacterium]|nr:restriction endonuclease subunit S [Oscillospiraceae bacterium]
MSKLGDICFITMGQSPDSATYNESGNGLPFFQGNADFGKINPTTRIWCSEPKKIANPGDILISVRAPIGALNIADIKCCIGRGLASLTVNDDKSIRKYIWYALESKVNEMISMGTGSTFKAIGKDVLYNLEIPLPPLEIQHQIAQTLDKVTHLIDLCNTILDKLDLLVKSRFVEMFGDLEAGTCIHPIKKLKELSIKISDGVHAKPDYTESGRPFLSVVNIKKRKVDFTDCKYVSEEAYQKMIKSTHPEKGDVLYTKIGATYGIPAYVDTDIEFCLYVSVCLIKPKHELINSKFLAIQMDMPFIKHQADRRIKGIGVPDLHLNQISEFDIVCPPRHMQDDFITFVEQTDKTKQAVKQILEKAETLKKALMQEYFK